MLPIKGFLKTTLVDYPGKVAATIFIGGCNFRCPFCHNADLVLKPDFTDEVSKASILDYLKEKRKWLDAVCITGGEPTLYPGLINLISELKELGLLVKLDTNGSNPQMVNDLLKKELIDYIAVDIKTSKNKYKKAIGSDFDFKNLEEVRDLLVNSTIDYEFRTTAVPNFVDEEDFIEIADFIKGAKLYSIQQYCNAKAMIDPNMKTVEPYSKEQLEKYKKIVEKTVDEVKVIA